ncbi:hypothetical protein SPWS13_1842 [Shewanella putrefaciens]|nr:hypothetical protein SPWS13_1842 [Shewanella putrefaciens]
MLRDQSIIARQTGRNTLKPPSALWLPGQGKRAPLGVPSGSDFSTN